VHHGFGEVLTEAADSPVTLVPIYQTMWCCISDDQNLIFAVVVLSAEKNLDINIFKLFFSWFSALVFRLHLQGQMLYVCQKL
jgi:hypothetical protein